MRGLAQKRREKGGYGGRLTYENWSGENVEKFGLWG